jgi:radical SAM-linked protein
MTDQTSITRIRVEYSKGPSLRFTGHLDMQHLWERLLRRSGLPIRYSQGFHSRARLNLASALPLGFTSEAELLDFWMNEPLPLEEVQQRLSRAAPAGLEIKTVQVIPLSEDALQARMHASEYIIHFFDPQHPENLVNLIEKTMAYDTIPRVRRKKSYDLRPLILDMKVHPLAEGEIGLWMRLNAEPGKTGRPDEVLAELGFENTTYLAVRSCLILSRDQE